VFEAFSDEGDATSQFRPMTGSRLGAGAVYAVQFLSPTPGFVVQGVGDSIIQGVDGESDFLNFGALAAAAVSTAARPVTWLQSGVGGSRSVPSFQRAFRDMRAGHVSVALIQTWSGNDFVHGMSPADAQRAADVGWQCAIAYALAVREQGGVPVFLTAVPQAIRTSSPELDATRMSTVARCHTLSGQGEYVQDLNGLIGDGGGTSGVVNYRPNYSTDSFHPNSLGHRAAELVLTSLLRACLAL
jgi:hypothetical protein